MPDSDGRFEKHGAASIAGSLRVSFHSAILKALHGQIEYPEKTSQFTALPEGSEPR